MNPPAGSGEQRYAVSFTVITATDEGPAAAASKALFQLNTGQLPGYVPGSFKWTGPVLTVTAEDGTVTVVDMNTPGLEEVPGLADRLDEILGRPAFRRYPGLTGQIRALFDEAAGASHGT